MDRQPDIRRLWYLLASVAVSVVGDGVVLAAAPLLAASLTQNPLEISLVSAAGSLAWVIVGLPAGALVDRVSLRLVMINADLARAMALSALAALVLFHWVSISWLVGGAFLIGAGACFFEPAAQASVPLLVSDRRSALHRANGYLWSVDTTARTLIGLPLGAILFEASRATPFATDALSFLASAALIARLPRAAQSPVDHPKIVKAIREGIRFAVSNSKLRAAAIGLGLYNVGWTTAMSTFVLFAAHRLGASSAEYGLVLACSAVGGLISGWSTPFILRRIDAGEAFSLVLLVQAMSWAAAYFSTAAWQVACELTVVGASTNMVSIVVGAVRQQFTPRELLGRVVATTRVLGIGSTAAGALIGGVVANAYGLRAPFAASAALLGCGAMLIWIPLHAEHLRHV